MVTETTDATGNERACAYRVLRYTPNLVRDEWVNIGVLVFDPHTGERRLRLIEEPEEYARVRRLHPRADEELLRALARLFRDEGMAGIIVEQHAHKILPITDRAIVLERGKVVFESASAALLADSAPLERYLGVTGG